MVIIKDIINTDMIFFSKDKILSGYTFYKLRIYIQVTHDYFKYFLTC